MKKTLFCLIVLGCSLVAAMAQVPTPTPDSEPPRRGVWRAELPGGTYIVMLSSITSVSIHEYLVDGAARVTEVNISTMGSEAVRFYYLEPNVPQTPNGIGQSAVNLVQEKAEAGVARAGATDVWQKVVKNYPTTTHAHTVEYRLVTKDSLKKLFDSVENAWLNRKAGTFKP